jgi:hypothetical protein
MAVTLGAGDAVKARRARVDHAGSTWSLGHSNGAVPSVRASPPFFSRATPAAQSVFELSGAGVCCHRSCVVPERVAALACPRRRPQVRSRLNLLWFSMPGDGVRLLLERKHWQMLPLRGSLVTDGDAQMRMLSGSALLLLATGVVAYGQGAGEAVVKLPDQIEWKAPPMVGGASTAILYGDPSKVAVYVTRTKFPAGLKAMPHTAPG